MNQSDEGPGSIYPANVASGSPTHNRQQIATILGSMAFDSDDIQQAFDIFEKTNGETYDIATLADIVVQIQEQRQRKPASKAKNTTEHQNNIIIHNDNRNHSHTDDNLPAVHNHNGKKSLHRRLLSRFQSHSAPNSPELNSNGVIHNTNVNVNVVNQIQNLSDLRMQRNNQSQNNIGEQTPDAYFYQPSQTPPQPQHSSSIPIRMQMQMPSNANASPIHRSMPIHASIANLNMQMQNSMHNHNNNHNNNNSANVNNIGINLQNNVNSNNMMRNSNSNHQSQSNYNHANNNNNNNNNNNSSIDLKNRLQLFNKYTRNESEVLAVLLQTLSNENFSFDNIQNWNDLYNNIQRRKLKWDEYQSQNQTSITHDFDEKSAMKATRTAIKRNLITRPQTAMHAGNTTSVLLKSLRFKSTELNNHLWTQKNELLETAKSYTQMKNAKLQTNEAIDKCNAKITEIDSQLRALFIEKQQYMNALQRTKNKSQFQSENIKETEIHIKTLYEKSGKMKSDLSAIEQSTKMIEKFEIDLDAVTKILDFSLQLKLEPHWMTWSNDQVIIWLMRIEGARFDPHNPNNRNRNASHNDANDNRNQPHGSSAAQSPLQSPLQSQSQSGSVIDSPRIADEISSIVASLNLGGNNNDNNGASQSQSQAQTFALAPQQPPQVQSRSHSQALQQQSHASAVRANVSVDASASSDLEHFLQSVKQSGLNGKDLPHLNDFILRSFKLQNAKDRQSILNHIKRLQSLTDKNNNNHTNDVSPERKTCVICINGEANYIMIPCGHICVCSECVPKIRKTKKCAFCGKAIVNIIKCYNVGI